MNKQIRKLLYRSFDDSLKPTDRQKLEDYLKNSAELRREKEQLRQQREEVANSAIQSFSPGFSQRVMEQIESMGASTPKPTVTDIPEFYRSLVTVFRRFVLAGGLAMAVLLVYNLGAGDILPLGDVLALPDLTLQEILSLSPF